MSDRFDCADDPNSVCCTMGCEADCYPFLCEHGKIAWIFHRVPTDDQINEWMEWRNFAFHIGLSAYVEMCRNL